MEAAVSAPDDLRLGWLDRLIFVPEQVEEEGTKVDEAPLIEWNRGESGWLSKLSVSRDLDRDLALLGLICIAIGGLRSRRGVETGSKGDVWPEIAEDVVEIVVRGGPIPKEGDR